MIAGNHHDFAIESEITQVYDQASHLALGFFVLYVKGNCYGVRKEDATMLGCSYDEVKRRISKRGQHIADFAKLEAGQIADAFRSALYAEIQEESYFEIELSEFCSHFQKHANDLLWAPDGDAAFDDGSYVLQFDIKDRVRLIAFKSGQENSYDPATLSELWLPSKKYYQILQQWIDSFEAELAKKRISLNIKPGG